MAGDAGGFGHRDQEIAFPAHGVAGVDGHVDDGRVELARVGVDVARRAGHPDIDSDA